MFSEFNSLAVVYGQARPDLIDPNPPYTISTGNQATSLGTYIVCVLCVCV